MPRGFTLVELMVVISIIAILVSMLFTVIIGAKDKARKKQALTEAYNIVLALKTYYAEYEKWPNQIYKTNDTTYFANNYLVIRELVGQNQRKKAFLAVPTNQIDSAGNFVDPWGIPYVICLDDDLNGNCTISVTNFAYYNSIGVPSRTNIYSYGYSVPNMDVAVASFANTTNSFPVETWSEPR